MLGVSPVSGALFRRQSTSRSLFILTATAVIFLIGEAQYAGAVGKIEFREFQMRIFGKAVTLARAAPDAKIGVRPHLGLAVFFAVAFGLAWTGWLLTIHVRENGNPFSSFRYYWFTAAPSLAGFVAAYAEGGWMGLKGFCARVLDLRFALWPIVLGFAIPLLAAFLTFALHMSDLLHGGLPKPAVALSAVTLQNFFTGPLAEEFGWRGYLLGRLCRRWPPAVAGLVIGPIWVLWHLPIFYGSVFAHWTSALGFLLWATSWAVVFALLVARARGSVLPSILGHWTINSQLTLFAALLPSLPQEDLPGGIAFAITSALVAAGLAYLWRDTHCDNDYARFGATS
jgi:membrane protease YdiL (CAAX protease family)